MEKIKEVIIVEGKTDTAILKEIFDVTTIETKGLQLNKETQELIKKVAENRGIIILTDPDYPGMKIRNQINQLVPNAKNAFVQKKDAIKNKKVGIAEATKEAIIEALKNKVTYHQNQTSISWEEFIDLGLIGNKARRLKVYDCFNLGYGNAKSLFKRLNLVGISAKQIREKIDE